MSKLEWLQRLMAEYNMDAASLKATRVMAGLRVAVEAGEAPYMAEVAAAYFEGRVPPSAEVFWQEYEETSGES